MAESMVEIAIIRSIISYVSRIYKAYRRGVEPRVSKTIYPIPDSIKLQLKQVVVQCKDENVFDILDVLVQNTERVRILEESHRKAFQEFQNGFTAQKFLKWFAVSIVIGAELEARGFCKALEVVERDIHVLYGLYRNDDVFKQLGFRVA